MTDVTETQNESSPITLAEIAGQSIDTITEVRFEDLPAMRAAFTLSSFDFAEIEMQKAGVPSTSIVCKLGLKVVQVEAFNDDGDDSEERKAKMVGKSHNETIFIKNNDVEELLGRVKAFLSDCGFEWEAGVSINDVGKGAAASNIPFIADVKKRPKKNSEGGCWTNVQPVRSENVADDSDDAA